MSPNMAMDTNRYEIRTRASCFPNRVSNSSTKAPNRLVNPGGITGLAMNPISFEDDMKLGRRDLLYGHGLPNCSISDSGIPIYLATRRKRPRDSTINSPCCPSECLLFRCIYCLIKNEALRFFHCPDSHPSCCEPPLWPGFSPMEVCWQE